MGAKWARLCGEVSVCAYVLRWAIVLSWARYLDGLGSTWQTMYRQEPCGGISDELCATLLLLCGSTAFVAKTVPPLCGPQVRS